MKQCRWKPYAAFILLSEAVGGLSALLTMDGMKSFGAVRQSPLSPPPVVFPIVWTALFALMGIGAARVWIKSDGKEREGALRVFGVQLLFNFFWSVFYFNLHAFAFSFFWLIALWLLILWMTVKFSRCDKAAGYLQLPYLVWVGFAGYLNYATWMLNR